MTESSSSKLSVDILGVRHHQSVLGSSTVTHMKARQSAKIRELGEALVASGYVTLDEQAKALGLSRSTTWTILRGHHKGSGISAALINRMLPAPQLPSLVSAKILEYVEEKSAGCYGSSKVRLNRFVARLSIATNLKDPHEKIHEQKRRRSTVRRWSPEGDSAQ